MAGETRQERRRIADSYAQALYEVAEEKGRLDLVRRQLVQLRGLLETVPRLGVFFESPVITTKTRRALIDRLAGKDKAKDKAKDQFDPIVISLLRAMNRRRRLGLLGELIDAFMAEDDRRQGKIPVTLTTAEPTDKQLSRQIQQVLGQFLSASPMIEHRIRPEILGGFIVRAGDLLIDASVQRQLSMVKENLLMRGEDEIQSGRDYVSNQT